MDLSNRRKNEDPSFGDDTLKGAQNLMFRDKPLTPKMIASLMNVSAVPSNLYKHTNPKKTQESNSFLYISGVILSSLLISGIVGMALMYEHKIGFFYDQVTTRE